MARDSFPDLSSRQLGAVLAVTEYRSFVAAANALKMSQPALTRTIKQVEAELGVPLFQRSNRQVSVTRTGRELAAHAERLLNDLKISVASMRELAGQPRGQIEVRALSAAPLVSFPPDSRTRRVVDAAAAAEGLRLRYLMTTNRLPTLHGLVRNGVGLAVVPASERPETGDSGLDSRRLTGRGLSCQIGIMRVRERELTPQAAEFLAVVRTWLRTFRRGVNPQ